MTMKKRILAALLSTSLLASGMVAFAADTEISDDLLNAPTVERIEEHAPAFVGEFATILEVSTDDSATLLVQTDSHDQLSLMLTDDTLFLDTQTGTPVNASDIAVGDKVYVYYNTQMTFSLPPQAAAQAVVVNLTEEHAPASLEIAENITYNADGSLTVTTDNGGTLLTLPADVRITPYATRNIVTLSDIHVGTRFFAWYDVKTMSYPSQAATDKVVLPPQEDREFLVSVNDKNVEGCTGRVQDGVAMIPARKVAEALGYKVTWNAADKSITLSNGSIQTTITPNQDLYAYSSVNAIGMSAPTHLGAASFVEEGVSWIPAELFSMLGNDLTLFDGILSLHTNK